MPSSTSSSEPREELAVGRRFLGVTLGWCGLFLALYATWFTWAQPTVDTYQSFSAANAGLAEQWLHGERRRAVLVGSSLTHFIPPEVLGADVQNMAFSRESALTGLSIVAGAEVKPAIAVIEVNYIVRDIDDAFVEGILSPTRAALRSTIPIFRTAAQPINVVLSGLRASHGRSVEEKMADSVDPEVLGPILASRISGLATPPASDVLDERIATLTTLVQTLEAAGTVPVFLRMPVEPELERTVYAQTIRRRVEAAFPLDRYRWVDTARDAPYRTTDSEHLLFRDAWYVGERIAQTVEAMISDTN